MKTVLLTGFEPFGNTPINPAESVARTLHNTDLKSASITSRIVPNTFFECIEIVTAAIETIHPDIIIMMGEFGGRATITVERIAQNRNDATRYDLVDNQGNAPQDVPTAPEGPAAYYSTLPIRAMVKSMLDAGIPAEISDAPGTFCCNHLMYGVLHHLTTHDLPVRTGWIHLPHLPEVAALNHNLGNPSMSAETAASGVKVAVQAALDHETDINSPIPGRLQI
ncbi:MAG: pyroglutamyl-peptidase I [Verrucomicrobiota bacterium]